MSSIYFAASNDVSKGPYELTVTSNMDYKGVSASQNLMSKFNCAPADNFPKVCIRLMCKFINYWNFFMFIKLKK